jgi:VanZ family protein
MIKKNRFSILLAAFILYVSLISSESIEKVTLFNIPFFDKIVHFGMYFVLMAVIILENRKAIKSTRELFLISIIPFLYGALIEILQSSLTVSRSASLYDIIFNSAGILFSSLLWLWIKPVIKETIR